MRYIFALSSFVALLAVACGGGGGKQPAPTQTAASTAAPSPTSQPAAETLAFLRDGDVWLIDADGGNERRLTRLGGTGREVTSVGFLSDGTVAYHVSLVYDPASPPPATFTSVLTDLEGNVLWEREAPADGGTNVSWSPDGRLVAVRDQARLLVETREGRTWWDAALRSTRGYGSYRGVSWAPAAGTFAYIDGEEIVVVTGDPPVAQRLTMFSAGCPSDDCPNRAVFGGLAFSPDARRLVALVTREQMIAAVGNAPWETYRIDLGAEVTRTLLSPPLTSDRPQLGNVHEVVFSPDGRFVVYDISYHISACENGASLLMLPVEGIASSFVPRDVAAAIADFAPRGPDTSRGTGLRWADFDWSPTGDKLAVSFEVFDCSFMGGVTPGVDPILGRGVYVVDAQSLSEDKLSDDAATSRTVWSPSGQMIAYATQRNGASAVRVIDVATHKVTDLGSGSQPAWQPQQ